MRIIGPFSQIVTLRELPMRGPLTDDQLEVITAGGVMVNDQKIVAISSFDHLIKRYPNTDIEPIDGAQTLLPGFVDCHTHICFAGNRARDYALRVAGKSYLEIAKAGGGIWDSVTQTRQAPLHELAMLTAERANRLLHGGITTIEVKSGYGLDTENELKMLRAIAKAKTYTFADLVPTCLAAHMKPRDFDGDATAYLSAILQNLLPIVRSERLSDRVDIFVEDSAFGMTAGKHYLQRAKQMGFTLTVHADQFTTGGSKLAVALRAASADHLEASTDQEVAQLARSETTAVVLPGAAMGLGIRFAPTRKLLDGGACVAIASDWNPGSAPMGDLLLQAAVLGAYEKLTVAETLAALTFRAANALKLTDRGKIADDAIADMQAYPTADYRDILYHQGSLKPIQVWKRGKNIR